MEYTLIAAVIAIALIGVFGATGGNLENLLEGTSNTVNNALSNT